MRPTTKKVLYVAAAILAVLIVLRWLRRPTEGFAAGPTAGADSFTFYYADWCPHCKSVKPVFKQWSEKKSMTVGSKTVFLNMVEADQNPEVIKANNVKGFPTFILARADGSTKEFDGDRTPAGWQSWLEANL